MPSFVGQPLNASLPPASVLTALGISLSVVFRHKNEGKNMIFEASEASLSVQSAGPHF